MDISLSKLPWYGQIGAFVVVSGLAVFGFWKFYVAECRPTSTSRQTRLTALRADISKGVATARRLPQFQSRGRGTGAAARESSRGAAGAEGRRRHPAPRSGAGDAVEPEHSALHAAGAEAGSDVRGAAVQAAGRGHLPQPRDCSSIASASSRESSTSARSRSNRGSRRTQPRASKPSASRRPSFCRKARLRPVGAVVASFRSSRQRNEHRHDAFRTRAAAQPGVADVSHADRERAAARSGSAWSATDIGAEPCARSDAAVDGIGPTGEAGRGRRAVYLQP